MVTGNTKSANAYDYSQQNNVTASRVLGTVYQNTTGRAMFVLEVSLPAALGDIFGYTDSSNPPTTVVAAQTGLVTAKGIYIFFIVLPGNYYKIAPSSGTWSIYVWNEYT